MKYPKKLNQTKSRIWDHFKALRPKLAGDLHVEDVYRKLYSTDASNYQVEPYGVMFPKTVEDVQKALQFCGEKGIPIISRGGGTSLSGQSVGTGLIVDYSKYMDEVGTWDPESATITVAPGVVLANLNAHLLTWQHMIGPDPASAPVACIGGMTGNNSTGTRSIVYGMMLDQVEAITAVCTNGEVLHFAEKSTEDLQKILAQRDYEAGLYQGVLDILQRYRGVIQTQYPKTWRNVAGYNLNRLLETYDASGKLNLASLLVGSEGTLASMVKIKVKTVPKPICTQLALLHFDDLDKACEAVPALLHTGPSAVEFSNDYFHELIDNNAAFQATYRSIVKGVPAAMLIVEYSGDNPEILVSKFDGMRAKLKELDFSGEIVYRKTPEEVATVWNMRKSGFGLLMSQRGDSKPQTFADDATVPVQQLPGFMREMQEIFAAANIRVAMLGHASAGCIHMNPNINLKNKAGIQQMKDMAIAIAETAMKYGGTTTGEHGEGLAKSYFTEQLYGEELYQAFKEVKQLFDPQNLMQPGKIVDAVKPWSEEVLRYNSSYETPHAPVDTILDFSRDGGYGGLVEMCNGTGFCRKDQGGVMCPSYRATRDERHATRGRANALRAAIKGELEGGLSNPELYETLDLCLECKACKVECPSVVDMAKLKYEYLYQYQQKHGVPLKSKLFAHVHRLNQAFRPFRAFYNFALRQKAFRFVMEMITGIDRRRALPLLSRNNFQAWARQNQAPPSPKNGRVILWDDTYLTFNQPELGLAAVKVLEQAGYEVLVLEERVCCGRPMISKGLLEEAKTHAQKNVAVLLPYVQQGLPILGLEPSCIASFQDEYPDLLQTEAAREVAQASFFIEDFLVKEVAAGKIDWPFASAPGPKIKFHGHCYQKALGETKNSVRLLAMIPGAEVEEIDAGCCGMAGSFGYEKNHYQVSMAVGEEALFPAIRAKGSGDLIAASGVSCRHQIADGTGEKALHPIEILANFLS